MFKQIAKKWLLLVILIFSFIGTAGGESGLPTVETDENRLSSVGKIFVRGFKFEGNSIFSESELAQVLAPYTNRQITAEELQEARNKLSLYYYNSGYVNSGALIPDQEIKEGVILIQIIEGRLSEVIFTGNSWLRTRYIEKRFQRGIDYEKMPLNVTFLQDRLKLLKQDIHIENVNAELNPGLNRGESSLKVQVEEAKPWYISAIFNNHNSPSIGSYRFEVNAGHINLTGWGDSLDVMYAITEGLDDYSVSYTVPISRWDTTLSLDLGRSESSVIADPFSDIDLRSETTTYSAKLRHPLYKTLATEFALGLELGKSESKTFVGDDPFPFTGSPDAVNKSSVLRFSQEWVHRSITQVIAVHSTLNFGMDIFDATVLDTEPDGKFFSWIGQFQLVQQLGWLDSQAVFRLYLQISNDPLLPTEKFAIGGSSTVRGYRENLMTTDNGAVSILEWRIPVATLKAPVVSKDPGDGVLQIIPFIDCGRGWNIDADDPDPDMIYSMGLGARWSAGKMLQAEIYWGYGFEDSDTTDEHDIQDDGVHFQVNARF